jgi:23S rRNA (adenine2503-C2)-methyltransferase
MRDIKELSLNELKADIVSRGFPGYHARQIFSWIYQKDTFNFSGMSNLPVNLRKTLADEFFVLGLRLAESQKSADGTEKFLFRLNDGNFVEAVDIPFPRRNTACISTQAGCKFACEFCASGAKGFKRNLSAGEILDEVLYLKKNNRCGRPTHIVFMGTGEPLDNYDNVLKAIRTINSPDALNIGARRITISTCGIIPGIRRLQDEDLQVELSISLHAADDKLRSEIMPVNRKYPLDDLFKCCSEYIGKTNRQITFEYILIKGINSGIPSARKLAGLMQRLRLAKVNLIPANPVADAGGKVIPPTAEEADEFKEYLSKQGVNVTLRKERGQDIDAACGQLRLKYEKS